MEDRHGFEAQGGSYCVRHRYTQLPGAFDHQQYVLMIRCEVLYRTHHSTGIRAGVERHNVGNAKDSMYCRVPSLAAGQFDRFRFCFYFCPGRLS